MTDCISLFDSKDANESYKTTLGIMIGFYLILSIYIIYKMCQLCSKAFSYTNFHIHEAYKFYSIALMSTFLIIINRIIEVNIPTDNESLSEGWKILNQIIGLISIFAMNQTYIINALTWLMVDLNCDFTNQQSVTHLELTENYEKNRKKQKIILRFRKFFLYYFIPITMLLAVFGELYYQQNWCKASKAITAMVCSITFLIFVFSFSKILYSRFRSDKTSKKVKLIWLYLIVMMSVREILVIMNLFQYQIMNTPADQEESIAPSIIFLIFYVIFMTIIPVLFLSYLADKQLVLEQQSIDRQSQVLSYNNALI